MSHGEAGTCYKIPCQSFTPTEAPLSTNDRLGVGSDCCFSAIAMASVWMPCLCLCCEVWGGWNGHEVALARCGLHPNLRRISRTEGHNSIPNTFLFSLQTMNTFPRRFTTRHASHSFFTAARTLMASGTTGVAIRRGQGSYSGFESQKG